MLFHYHFWTPNLEETEKFYIENGFRISLRLGKYQGDYQTFNPPLEWNDFREKDITFRIIEARKGAINITFGFGNRVMFDHIGFLANPKEPDVICNEARKISWKVRTNNRRTFISTPYGFRIELQSNMDAIDGTTDIARIEELELFVNNKEFEKDFSQLFNKKADNIHTVIGKTSTINKAVMSGILISNKIDPNGVSVIKKEN